MSSPDLPAGYGGCADQMVIQRLRQEGLVVFKGSNVIDDLASFRDEGEW